MNPDEILNMEAGDQMDSLIAERVMGKIPCQSPHHKNGEDLPCHANPDSPTMGGSTDPYSIDISSAWKVVEKLQAEPHNFSFSLTKFTDLIRPRIIINPWYAVIGTAHAFGSAAPIAICRAALLAVNDR